MILSKIYDILLVLSIIWSPNPKKADGSLDPDSPKGRNFAFKMMNFALKMMKSAVKNDVFCIKSGHHIGRHRICRLHRRCAREQAASQHDLRVPLTRAALLSALATAMHALPGRRRLLQVDLLKNVGFLSKSVDFLLKNDDFL